MKCDPEGPGHGTVTSLTVMWAWPWGVEYSQLWQMSCDWKLTNGKRMS